MTEFGKTEFLTNIQDEKALEIIENLKILMINSPQKHLPALRSLVTSSYSLSELNNLGFNMTKSKFEYSNKKIKDNKKITLNKNTNKNYSLKKEIIKKILAYVLKYCSETSQASNKKIGSINKDIEKEMNEYSTKIKYSLSKTKKEIYEDMKLKNEISISVSTFYKLVPNNIIKSKKKNKKCNICNIKKSLDKKKIECKATDSNVLESLENDLKLLTNTKVFMFIKIKNIKMI